MDSAISKRQGNQRKQNFLEKKILQKKEIVFTTNTQKYQLLCAMKQLTRPLREIFFHISKCLACNAEKNVTVEDNKQRMNITNFINVYTNIYTYIICDKNDSN